jgi:RND family efflux transporter MFP subunit
VSDQPEPQQEQEIVASPVRRKSGPGWWLLVLLCNVVLPPLVILGGIRAFQHLMATGPVAERKPPARRARLVEVATVWRRPANAVVEAMGTVLPAREVALRPRVSGEVREFDPRLIPGALFHAGDLLVRLDATDYELAVARRESELAKARADLALEMGNQRIARRELELLGEGVSAEDRALLLREPQLESIQAAIKAAEVALEEAANDVGRTEIRAPFNCLVQERLVDIGARVSPTTTLASLIGTDEYRVEVSLPVASLRHLGLSAADGEKSVTARIYDEAAWGSGVLRHARVVGLIGSLETAGRMARLLLSVADPLAIDAERGQAMMHLGSFVRTEIDGGGIGEVVAIDSEFLREGESVWLLDAADRLEIRRVTVAYRQRGTVFVSEGLSDGDRLVTTDLSTPVPGMPLRLAVLEYSGEPATLSAPGSGEGGR